jgi:hypothetical protein
MQGLISRRVPTEKDGDYRFSAPLHIRYRSITSPLWSQLLNNLTFAPLLYTYIVYSDRVLPLQDR